MTLIEQLGEEIAGAGAPPPALRELLALHVVDVLGGLIAALRTAEGGALLRWRKTQAMGIAGTDAMGRLRLDVAAHCALARLSEIDDIHLGSTTTPGAIVIPGALAAAAAFGIGDPALLSSAMVAGYEVMVRLARAIGGASALYRGLWPTYFAAPAAMAAVAARLLGFDAEKAAQALALALMRTSPGVGRHNAATTFRWLAIGEAAASGVEAALSAQSGFTGDLLLLDGEFLPGVYGITPDRAALSAPKSLALNETSFKPWCAARQTMAATQALIEVLATGIAPDAIGRVKAFVPPPHRRMVDHGMTIGDRSSFLTSLPYRLAVAAIHPESAFEVAQAPEQVPPELLAFVARVDVAADERLMAHFPYRWPARIEVTTSAGHRESLVTHVPGDPQRPFDAAAVEEKFRRFAVPAVGHDASARLLERARGLLTGASKALQLMHDLDDIAGRSV